MKPVHHGISMCIIEFEASKRNLCAWLTIHRTAQACDQHVPVQILYALQATQDPGGTEPMQGSSRMLHEAAAFPLSCELSCLALVESPSGEHSKVAVQHLVRICHSVLVYFAAS